MTKIIAHRGLHRSVNGIIENTIPAFEEAVKVGANIFELDVHLTSDEQWIVYHDFSFKNGRKVAKMSYDSLMRAAEEQNYIINRFEDVLHAFPNVHFNVECKPRSFEIGKKLTEFMTEQKNSYNISSFSIDTLKGARSVSDDIKLSIIDLTFLLINWRKLNEELNLYSINPFFAFTSKKMVTLAHKHNVEVYVWTVNKEKVMRRQIKKGVDGIITDYADIGLNIVQ